ncbi:hypothetical protein ACQCT3_18070 [Sutcliffiella horikoshii]|uniref:hypothetical protein n=1 Tax=Sutcliffiella horikoshii TaxID=79883 RepID=UPI003CF6A8EB
MYFEETEPVYKVLNHANRSMTEEGRGFYESVFTEDYGKLDIDDQNMVIGVLLGDYGWDIKDLVDMCLEERLDNEE